MTKSGEQRETYVVDFKGKKCGRRFAIWGMTEYRAELINQALAVALTQRLVQTEGHFVSRWVTAKPVLYSPHI
jgi:hypothetical protein